MLIIFSEMLEGAWLSAGRLELRSLSYGKFGLLNQFSLIFKWN